MYTRCPECETTFRLGAQDLRRAGGKVRCGECATVFNALEFLEEEAESPGPTKNAWQTEPANDEHSEPYIEQPSPVADEVAGPTLYHDDYDGPIGESDSSNSPAGFLTDAPSEQGDAGLSADEPDDDADIAVTGLDDSPWIDDETSTEVSIDVAGDDQAFADAEPDATEEQERWPTYTEPDSYNLADTGDEDEIVSFVTSTSSSVDYPEVNQAVSSALGASQTADTAYPETEKESSLTGEAAPDDDLTPAFNDDLDIDMADKTVEFSISDDSDADIVTIISDSPDDIEGETDADTNQQYADTENDDDLDEFDDTVWERIPGVGAGETASDDPLFVRPGFRTPGINVADPDHADDAEHGPEPGVPEEEHTADATDAASPEYADESEDDDAHDAEPNGDADTLEFNAPANTWSNIFSRSTRTMRAPGSGGDTQPVPVLSDDKASAEDEELSAWSSELNESTRQEPQDNDDPDAIAASGERADWVSELDPEESGSEPADDDELAEWVVEVGESVTDVAAPAGEEVAETEKADWVTEQEGTAGRFGAKAPPTGDAATPTGEESDADSDDDAASLTAAFSSGEYDEAEYDVQHIILADESEPDSAGLTQTFATAADDAPPPWQPDGQENLPTQNSRATLWLVGGVLVVATLLMQLVHYNRDSLARNLAWGETIRNVYSGLGMELFPNWSLNDYEIRGSEAIAGESGPDIMDIRAQIAATGSEPTGLPHIRVVLRDRWSNPVAAKTLGPAEYASPESLPPGGLLQPSETLAAHVSIIDPGSGAQGFELELCLPRRHTGLECTGRPFE